MLAGEAGSRPKPFALAPSSWHPEKHPPIQHLVEVFFFFSFCGQTLGGVHSLIKKNKK
jgi:hypothetical protein